MENLVLKIMRAKAKTALTQEEEALFTGLGESLNEALASEKVERNNMINEIAKQLGTVEEGESLTAIIRALSAKVESVEQNSRKTFNESEKFMLRKALEKAKPELVAARRGGQPFEMEFKAKRAASAMMTTGTILTGATAFNTDNVFDDLEVTVIRYPTNFILDAINSRQVSKVPAVIKWKEQVTAGDGVIGAVSEGATKTLVDKKFIWKYAERVKYAGRIEYTEEAEIDFEQLTLQVIGMFEQDVLRAYNAGVLAAIIAWAPVYAGTALDGTIIEPTLMNVVSAGKLQLALQEYTGDLLILNPADYAGTQNMQNVNGDPIFVPDNVLFPGLRLFVTNKIDAGTALLGESGIVKEQHGSFILRSGTYGTQFIENEKTIVGEIFSIMELPEESKKGWVKLVIATVKEALLKEIA